MSEFDVWAAKKYPNASRKDSLGGFSRDLMRSAREGWYAHAELAALKAGQGEAVELSVWCESMPESNGKSSYTAILHRKGECISEGIIIDRGEYPDRVRYEADCMRYLIGELTDEPDILAYDADAHSGYTAPPTSADAVSVPRELHNEAEICAFVLENIGSLEPGDIDGDDIDLRFEDADGRDTGSDVSIVEYAERAAKTIRALLVQSQGVK